MVCNGSAFLNRCMKTNGIYDCLLFIPFHLQAWARLEQLAMSDVAAVPSASVPKENTSACKIKDFVGTSFLLYRVGLFDWLMI